MRIYLAGPEVFLPNAIEEGERLKALCHEYGHEGVFPLDGDINIDGLSGWEIADAIFEANIDKIDMCSAVIANMTPFRGPGMDGGTAFELGYAYAENKLIVGWTSDDRDYIDRVRPFYDGKIERTDRWRDPDGMEVEDFGQPDNLMMSSAAMDVVDSFEAALHILKQIETEAAKHGVEWK